MAAPGWLADEPHHDGSALYVDAGPHQLGDTVAVRLRIPDPCGTDRVRLRSVPDAEPFVVDAVPVERDPGAQWWQADLLLHNPVTNYRWLLDGGELGRCWVNGAGVFHRDVTDDADFRMFPDPGPSGTGVFREARGRGTTVGYQVFVDRFANSGHDRVTPEWAIPRAWDEPVVNTPGLRSRHWYGGDLPGIEAHLDHLEHLGIDLLYLTPFFPAGSMHRYDAASFDHADPALGGDEALTSLITAAHARGIRVIGDLTLNHSGVGHDWFRTASTDPESVERGFYFFDDAEPDGYVAWHGVRSLPKLDHRSDELARRLYDGSASVVARYIDELGLDGWRIDCANTTARLGELDRNADVARRTRATIDSATAGATDSTTHRSGWLLAEHCYDAGADLDGTGWHGVMAYQWFTRPLWAWLKDPAPISLMSAVELIDLDGEALVESMRHLAANIPWAAQQDSMTMLDSHDTARFRTVVGGDRVRHLLAMTALLTMPGVPTLFAGSEIGCEGDSADTARVPFPWGRLAQIDAANERPGGDLGAEARFLADVRRLIQLRRASGALRDGSLRFVDATADSVTYARETADEVAVVHLVRSAMPDREVSAQQLGIELDREHDWYSAMRFGAPCELIFPDRVVLPGTIGPGIVIFPR